MFHDHMQGMTPPSTANHMGHGYCNPVRVQQYSYHITTPSTFLIFVNSIPYRGVVVGTGS